MEPSLPEVLVAPDRFEVVTEDVVLRAELQSAIAICLFDAVDECGALLHLRFIVRGAQPADVTDTTLATELLLLDRCIEALRETAPAARNLEARIAAQLPQNSQAGEACEKVLTLIGHFLSDVGARVTPPDIAIGPARSLRFRPTMGWINVR